MGVFAEREREANIFITSTTAADVTPEQSQTLLHGCSVEIYKFATWGRVALAALSTCILLLESIYKPSSFYSSFSLKISYTYTTRTRRKELIALFLLLLFYYIAK